jgi:hypothetical protein
MVRRFLLLLIKEKEKYGYLAQYAPTAASQILSSVLLLQFRGGGLFGELRRCDIGEFLLIIKCCGTGSGIQDPGSGAFLIPGSGMGKKSGSGSGMNNPDHISDSLETIFWVKILNSLMRIRDGKSSDPR